METKNKVQIKNDWEVKWLREGIFMPFGSMVNAYGQIHQQQATSLRGNKVAINKFLEDMWKIYETSTEMVKKSIENSQPISEEERIIEEADVPLINEKK